MLKGAIFDFDGTLFDSMFIWDTIGETYLRSIGYEPKENLNEVFKTLSLYQAAHYYQSEYGVTLSADEIMTGVNNMVERYYREEVIPKPGVIGFLERLRQNGVIMCIATATDDYLVRATLERCQMDRYFSEIFTCNSVGSGKDKPYIYREALAHLGAEKAKAIVLEDAVYALKTAKNDGFVTAAVYDRYEKNQVEVKALSDFYITDYSAAENFWKFASAI